MSARANAINAELYRPIKSGKQYDKYMPYSDCSSVKLAQGDTKVAIDNMAYWSRRYQHHTKKLAVIFANKGLKDMCKELHGFMYSNFQYKIDGIKQNLRSPACSWATRSEGIDCKSYSIFASTVLANLGVSHYLRRIKQSPNEGYSHVYTIVPIDQKNPKNLEKGYYTIDGTLKNNSEPIFYKKDDVFMEAELPIYGLAGTQQNQEQQGLGWVTMVVSIAMPLINQVMGSLIEEINSCEGERFDPNRVKFKLEHELKISLEEKLKEIDNAIVMQNRTMIQRRFNELFRNVDLGLYHIKHELSMSAWNDCDNQVLTVAIKYINKVAEILNKTYEGFKNTNKRFEIEEFEKEDFTSNREMYFVVGIAENPTNAKHRYIVLRDKLEKKYAVDVVFPFGENANEWLLKNIKYLKDNYGLDKADKWEEEIKPYLEKVRKLRNKYYHGGEMLYYFEQSLQRQMYKVWLKYDVKFQDFFKKEAESIKTANELALREYEARFKDEVKSDKKAKKRKKIKLQLGLTALTFTGLFILNKVKKNS